jgi:hypothetical protein
LAAVNGKEIPSGCASILALVLERDWNNDFSFSGVHHHMMEKWGDVLFGPIDEDKLEAAQKMLEQAEKRRQESMEQYEADGVAPFVRSLPTQVEGPVADIRQPSKTLNNSERSTNR